MPTNTELKRFAQAARRQLREQVALRLEQVLGVDSVEVREKKSAVDQLRQQIKIYPDDRLKSNYPGFGDALAKIPGLE